MMTELPRDLVKRVIEMLTWHDDCGPPGEGWQSETLLSDIAVMEAALAAPTAKGGTEVPAGWKLVPERPTRAMQEAGGYACQENCDMSFRAARLAYDAMLEASPPPPAGAAGGGSGDLGALNAEAREAVLAVVRTAWALVDNTGHHDLLPLAISRDDWDELAARLTALKALLPAEELPADPPHAVAYFWPAEATPVLSAPTPDLGAQGEPPGGCNGVTLETSKQMITALARGVSEASSGEGEPEDLRRERREDRDEASPKNEEPANWPEHMRGSELHPANRERVQHIDRLVAISQSESDHDV